MAINANNRILYHGSIIKVDRIDLSKSRNKLDFGKGFYTTASYEQACRWSMIKYDRHIKNDTRVKAVSKYSVSGFDALTIKEFTRATYEWLEFVTNNRRNTASSHAYDLVIGPIADDTTLLVINSYMNGLYGVGESAVQMAISLLKPEILEKQYAFCTEKAISRLMYEGCDYL